MESTPIHISVSPRALVTHPASVIYGITPHTRKPAKPVARHMVAGLLSLNLAVWIFDIALTGALVAVGL